MNALKKKRRIKGKMYVVSDFFAYMYLIGIYIIFFKDFLVKCVLVYCGMCIVQCAMCIVRASKFIFAHRKILQSPVEVSAVNKRKPRRTSTELKRH
jgi:hypothetical protein